MPVEVRAGKRVDAAFFPATAYADDGTAINNITTTSFIAGSPEVGVQFMTNAFGKVIITTDGGARGATANERIELAPQVFEGSSAAGTEVIAPDATSRGMSSDDSTIFKFGERATFLDDLTPNTLHYARVMYRSANGAGTGDIVRRGLTVKPTS